MGPNPLTKILLNILNATGVDVRIEGPVYPDQDQKLKKVCKIARLVGSWTAGTRHLVDRPL